MIQIEHVLLDFLHHALEENPPFHEHSIDGLYRELSTRYSLFSLYVVELPVTSSLSPVPPDSISR